MNNKFHHLVFGLLLFSGASLNAQQELSPVESKEIKETVQVNPVATSMSTVLLNGKQYLKIEFKNSASSDAKIVWSLLKGDEIVLSQKHNLVPGASTIRIFDATMPVILEENDQLENYEVILH